MVVNQSCDRAFELSSSQWAPATLASSTWTHTRSSTGGPRIHRVSLSDQPFSCCYVEFLFCDELCLWWADGPTVEQPQTGYQDSSQTYQSLVPQSGQFSPAMEGSHSPFLTGKGANTLQSKIPLPEETKISSRWSSFGVECNYLLLLQVRPSRATPVTLLNFTSLTARGRHQTSGLSSPHPATLPHNHTCLWPPAPPATALSLQNNTAPVWSNAKTPTLRGLTGRATWWGCRLIQVRILPPVRLFNLRWQYSSFL